MPIKIRALADGFRRCGVAHPATETLHPDDAFTAEQMAVLRAERMLVVEETPAEPAPPAARKTGAKPADGAA